ncbi:MAG: ABC transporter permease [Chloroflexi bacterium]|nr:ABC transporter permease [Chloroflexota bacterium]
MLSQLIDLSLLAATLRLATPIIYAAIGGLFSERSGVMNIALEGIMLIGAFVAVVVSFFTNDPWLGVLAAMIAGGLTAAIHAVVCIKFKADQIVSATGINILGAGLPGFLLVRIWGQYGMSPLVPGLSTVRLPLLSDVPIVGPVLGSQNPLVYVALLLVLISHIFFFWTPLGLRIRAVGEHPRAADTAGIDVFKLRYACVITSGVLAGIGGAYLSVGQLSQFSQLMTQGRGFMGLAAMIFGNWKPVGALIACLLFGFADALQMSAQAMGVPLPPEFLQMVPYVLTLIAVTGFIGRAIAPAAIGRPYEKD